MTFEHWSIATAVFEIFFVGGLFYGLPAHIFIMKEQGVFNELCEEKNQTSGCIAQDEQFNAIFVRGLFVATLFSYIFGVVLDKYGLLTARLSISTSMSLGLLLMVFYENRIVLEIGIYFIAAGALGLFLTNMSLQSLLPKHASKIGSIYSGTVDGSAGVYMLTKVLYQKCGVSLTTVSILLVVLSSIAWIRTVFLMPTTTVPRQLEAYNLKDNTLFRRVKQRNNEENKMLSEKPSPPDNQPVDGLFKQFLSNAFSLQYFTLFMWFAVVSVRINSFQAWFNNSLNWWFPGDHQTQSELTDIFGLTYLLSIPISPIPGLIVDHFAASYRRQGQNEQRGNTIGLAIMISVCSLLAAAVSFLSTVRGSYATSVTCQIVFSVCRTFSYAIMAQAVFLLYPGYLFGAIFGSISLANGAISLIADPLFRFIQNNLDGDYTMVHYCFGVVCILSMAESIVLVMTKK